MGKKDKGGGENGEGKREVKGYKRVTHYRTHFKCGTDYRTHFTCINASLL